MRIAKYLASCGVASRRKSEELVLSGKTKVNDEIIFDLGRQIEPTDTVLVNDEKIEPKEKVYYLLNKPSGYTSTVSDEHAEKIITELVPEEPPVWPVGRLDKETEGLIILTNDGELTQKLTHPSFEKEKEYVAVLDKDLSEKDEESILEGVDLEDGPFRADNLVKLAPKTYQIRVHEGRNRLVRRVFGHFGSTVRKLSRIRLEDLQIGELGLGKWRLLTADEVGRLKND
jgi:23S rRNA pseudouridine2605 synthase